MTPVRIQLSRTAPFLMLLAVASALCGCGIENYRPPADQHEDAPTGSHLSGTDTGSSSDTTDPSANNSNLGGAGGGGK